MNKFTSENVACRLRSGTNISIINGFMLFVFIYIYWCPTQFPYQMMFVSFNSNTTGATSGVGSSFPSEATEFTTLFKWVSRCSIFSFLCIHSILSTIVCLFVLFILAIALFALLIINSSDYPFGIFKLSCEIKKYIRRPWTILTGRQNSSNAGFTSVVYWCKICSISLPLSLVSLNTRKKINNKMIITYQS